MLLPMLRGWPGGISVMLPDRVWRVMTARAPTTLAAISPRALWATSSARGTLCPTDRNVVKGIFPAVGTPSFETLTRRSLEAAIACHVNHPRRRHACLRWRGTGARGGRKPISRAAWADAGRPSRVGPPRSGAL
jgi:hypothetical protein